MFSLSPFANATTTPVDRYIDAMPEPAQVLRDYSDPDSYKAAVMQHAALLALRDAIDIRTHQRKYDNPLHPGRWHTPAEKAKLDAYQHAMSRVRAQIEACKTPACEEGRNNKQLKQYAADEFRQSVLEKYFKGPWLNEHDQIRAEQRVSLAAHAKEYEKQERENRRLQAQGTGKPRAWDDILSDVYEKLPLREYPAMFRALLTHPDPGGRLVGWGLLVLVGGNVGLGLAAIFFRATRLVLVRLLATEGWLLGASFLGFVVLSGGCALREASNLHPVTTVFSMISAFLAFGFGSFATDPGFRHAVPAFVFGLMAWILFGLSNLV